jgi:hypothetical protein
MNGTSFDHYIDVKLSYESPLASAILRDALKKERLPIEINDTEIKIPINLSIAEDDFV